MTAKTISDKELLKLWRNPLFIGSFRGTKTFQACLKAKFSIVFRNRAEDIQSIHNLPKL